jgi:hypothetical protein
LNTQNEADMSEEESTTEKRETFGHPIVMQLEGKELERKNEDHVKVCNELEEIEGRKRTAMSGFNEELKLKRKQEISLRAMINSKSMQVEVECYPERDDRRGMMLTRRVDTGEIVDERALTAEERGVNDRQVEMFAVGQPAPAPADSDEEPEEERGDEDTENALSEYVANQAGSGDGAAHAGSDEDDEDDSDIDDDSEDAVAH